MAMELEHFCPSCKADRTFYRAGSMRLHLGVKTKWSCPECSYGFVRINGIESAVEV